MAADMLAKVSDAPACAVLRSGFCGHQGDGKPQSAHALHDTCPGRSCARSRTTQRAVRNFHQVRAGGKDLGEVCARTENVPSSHGWQRVLKFPATALAGQVPHASSS